MKNYTSGSVAAIMSLTIYLSACNQGSKVTEQNKASIINDIDGVYEYLPPGKGQSVNRNGRFVYLFGSPDGKGMTSQAGTYIISGDTVKNTVTYSTDAKQIGAVYWWKVKSWSGDTVSYNVMNEKREITGGGKAVRVSR
jgi:hypothetical protein